MIELGPDHLGGPVRLQIGAEVVICGTLLGVRHRLDPQGDKRTTMEVDVDGQVLTIVAPRAVSS